MKAPFSAKAKMIIKSHPDIDFTEEDEYTIEGDDGVTYTAHTGRFHSRTFNPPNRVQAANRKAKRRARMGRARKQKM